MSEGPEKNDLRLKLEFIKKYCYLSGDNFFYRLHPASHGFAIDCVQELSEFRQQLRIAFKIIAVVVHPMANNI